MSKLAALKIAAEIAKLGTDIYAVIVDKSRDRASKESRIAELEKQVAELKSRMPT
jgi:uncharacterized protein YceH (UPF0502 family)